MKCGGVPARHATERCGAVIPRLLTIHHGTIVSVGHGGDDDQELYAGQLSALVAAESRLTQIMVSLR